MLKKIFLITLSLLVALPFQQALAMESTQKSQQKCIQGFDVISPIKEPKGIAFVSNSTLAIGEPAQLCLFNIDKRTFIEFKENKGPLQGCYQITTNRDHTLLITANEWESNQYDIQKKQQLPQLITPAGLNYIAFTCDNNSVVYSPQQQTIAIKDVLTHLSNKYPYKPIACHPHKNSMLFPENNHTYHEAYINDDGYCSCDFNSQPLIELEDKNTIVGIEYNHDGTLIAVNERTNGCLLYENEKPSCWLYHETQEKPHILCSQYFSMAFNAHNILALLSWENIVQFWDCDTKKLILTIALDSSAEFRTTILTDHQESHLSISPDGKRVAALVNNRCLVFTIPPYARYGSKTIKSCLFMLFALNNYEHELEIIPPEIKHLIIKNVISL